MATPRHQLALSLILAGVPFFAQAQAPKPGPRLTNEPAGVVPAYSLARFGSLATPALADAAFSNAQAQLIASGGGLLLIPASAPADWTPRNNGQGVWLNPPAPAPSNKGWGKGPGVTVVDCRDGTLKLSPPQITGLEISRSLDLAPGTSLPHWEIVPMVSLKNTSLRGSNTLHAGIVKADTWSHNENQTFDVMMWRHNYSQGDNYLVDGKIEYMGDGRSATGCANAAIYSAVVQSDTALFRGSVEAWNPDSGELVYRAGARADTLGSGRPLINLNTSKWITAGRVTVNHPGGALLGWGGAVQAADAPWTSNVVGRYLAIDEPDEYVPGGATVRRWWPITGFAALTNGVKCLSFQRQWWGAKDGRSIGRLYRNDHYTTDPSKPRFLRYVIAPGANVYDVSDGAQSASVNPAGCRRLLRLAPYPGAGTDADFAPGDPVEQAIGADPFKPIPFRSWLWDAVPGVFASPVLNAANHGRVMRHAVMTVDGGSGNLARDRAERPDANPPYNAIVSFLAASRTGIRFEADTADAALLFLQPDGRPQVIRWDGNVPARLEVRPDGSLVAGGAAPLALAGGVLEAAGLSAGGPHSANLRGVAEPVAEGALQAVVKFQKKEQDDAYGVIVRPTWAAACAVTRQTEDGFEMTFDRPAPKGAGVHWILVR